LGLVRLSFRLSLGVNRGGGLHELDAGLFLEETRAHLDEKVFQIGNLVLGSLVLVVEGLHAHDLRLGIVIVGLEGLALLFGTIQPVLESYDMRLGLREDERRVLGDLTVHAEHLGMLDAAAFVDQPLAGHLQLLQLRGHRCDVLILQLEARGLGNKIIGAKFANLINLGLQGQDVLVGLHQQLLTGHLHVFLRGADVAAWVQ
jgi:hypothetical protein